MSETFHLCLSVRGALQPKALRTWARSATLPDGRRPTVDEFRDWLLDELSKGHEVVPVGTGPCEGFDFSGGGCPGHTSGARSDGGDG